MEIDFRCETIIRRPRAVVAAFMFDPKREPAWRSTVREARLVPEGTLAVGSRIHRIAEFRGARLTVHYEVTAFRSECYVHMWTRDPFSAGIKLQLADVKGGTTARLRAQMEQADYFDMTPKVLVAALRLVVDKDLTTLKRLLEDESEAG